jgi:hypothetical protein
MFRIVIIDIFLPLCFSYARLKCISVLTRTATAAISLETEVFQKAVFCYLILVLSFPLRV